MCNLGIGLALSNAKSDFLNYYCYYSCCCCPALSLGPRFPTGVNSFSAPPGLGGGCLPEKGVGLATSGWSPGLSGLVLCSGLTAQAGSPSPTHFSVRSQLGCVSSLFTLSGSFRGHVNHLGFCWPCVVRVINILRIELKLVIGTNPVYSIVIHLFNKYFLNPIMCQTLCWW